mmetsp:Transcript_241/g.655  ORF Transcript_241/g.655 Transcript_241/m.655 type:complete len:243 (+) Transcript_241:266-994(+)
MFDLAQLAAGNSCLQLLGVHAWVEPIFRPEQDKRTRLDRRESDKVIVRRHRRQPSEPDVLGQLKRLLQHSVTEPAGHRRGLVENPPLPDFDELLVDLQGRVGEEGEQLLRDVVLFSDRSARHQKKPVDNQRRHGQRCCLSVRGLGKYVRGERAGDESAEGVAGDGETADAKAGEEDAYVSGEGRNCEHLLDGGAGLRNRALPAPSTVLFCLCGFGAVRSRRGVRPRVAEATQRNRDDAEAGV